MKSLHLGDDICLARNNITSKYLLDRKNSLRLDTLIPRLSRLGILDEDFNNVLDKISVGENINFKEFDCFMKEIDLIKEKNFIEQGEKKEDIIVFLNSIKSFIIINLKGTIDSTKEKTFSFVDVGL